MIQGVKHKPTAEQRKLVEAMAAFGIPQLEICNVIGINKDTLLKYYRKELDTATATANTKIANVLYTKALAGDTACVIFWLKTRARWHETIRNEHSGIDGEPIKLVNIVDDL